MAALIRIKGVKPNDIPECKFRAKKTRIAPWYPESKKQ
jgi:hypothetical protein